MQFRDGPIFGPLRVVTQHLDRWALTSLNLTLTGSQPWEIICHPPSKREGNECQDMKVGG